MKSPTAAAWITFAALFAASATLAADGKAIRFGQTLKGELTASDPKAEDESLFDLYRFKGQAGDRVVLEMRSEIFDPFLALYGDGAGSGDPIGFDDDGAGGKDARIVYTLPRNGDYSVRANSLKVEDKGAYTLRLSKLPAASQVKVKAITVGQRAEGDLTRNSARAEDESFYDLYRFSGAKGDRLAIELKSRDFDAFLSVYKSGELTELGFDDDGGEDGDARLVFTLPHSGEFDVRANTSGRGETGHYQFSVQTAPMPGPVRIAYGEAHNGALSKGDAEADDDSLYDIYRFLGSRGDRVVVTMKSPDVDAYVSLHLKGRMEEIASDDDGARQGSDARLVFTLPSSGEFDIWANTLKPGETGAYEIRLERTRSGGTVASGKAAAERG